jgi:hypothetical protein
MMDHDEHDSDKMDFKAIFPNNGRRKTGHQFPRRQEARKAKTAHRRHEFNVGPLQTEPAHGSAKGVKTRIKKLMLRHPGITVDGLIEKLGNDELFVSRFLVAEIRSEFRHTLKLLKDLNLTVADIVI